MLKTLFIAVVLLRGSLLQVIGQETCQYAGENRFIERDSIVTIMDTIFIGRGGAQVVNLDSDIYNSARVLQTRYSIPITNLLPYEITLVGCKWNHIGLGGLSGKLGPGETKYFPLINGISARFFDFYLIKENPVISRSFTIMYDNNIGESQPYLTVHCHIKLIYHE